MLDTQCLESNQNLSDMCKSRKCDSQPEENSVNRNRPKIKKVMLAKT